MGGWAGRGAIEREECKIWHMYMHIFHKLTHIHIHTRMHTHHRREHAHTSLTVSWRAAGGPEDTGFLFQKFIDKAREYKVPRVPCDRAPSR